MKYTLSVLVENHPGVLSKVSGLFSRRAFNIDSLAVGITEDPNISRITIVADGDEYVVEQLEKQLNKIIPVIKVRTLSPGTFISRELSLIKVSCPAKQRLDIMKIAELMDAKIVDVSINTMTLQFADTLERFETLTDLLRPYGIREIVRTGTVAIEKDSALYISVYNEVFEEMTEGKAAMSTEQQQRLYNAMVMTGKTLSKDPKFLACSGAFVLAHIISALFADYFCYAKTLKDIRIVRENSREEIQLRVVLYNVGGTSVINFICSYFLFSIVCRMLMSLAERLIS